MSTPTPPNEPLTNETNTDASLATDHLVNRTTDDSALAQDAVGDTIVRTSTLAHATLAIALLALVIVGYQWVKTHRTMKQLEASLSSRLEEFNARNQQSLALAKNADERSSETSARAALLDQKLAESLDQQEALQTLYLELANNREERVISEVEQLMIIANQQLQLAGNVKPALLALQTADTRLQQLDAPQAMQLRKVLAQDIQRLQDLPYIDVIGMSLKLETLSESVDTLPLVSDRLPNDKSLQTPDWESNPWRKLVKEIWQDMKSMIRVERIDRPEPPLLAPDQTFFLRENIKLHLLTARIALLQHDEATYRTDLKAAEDWLKGHFDLRETSTRNALHLLDELSNSHIVVDMPDISDGLSQLSKYKLSLEHNDKRSEVTPSNMKSNTKPLGAAAKQPKADGSSQPLSNHALKEIE